MAEAPTAAVIALRGGSYQVFVRIPPHSSLGSSPWSKSSCIRPALHPAWQRTVEFFQRDASVGATMTKKTTTHATVEEIKALMHTRTLLTLLALTLTVTGSAVAQAPDTIWLDELTWTEVRDKIDGGTTTVIVATAGTEQNGPHMVLGKHKFIITEASERIARRLGNALVAPIVTYVPEGNLDPALGPHALRRRHHAPERALHEVVGVHGAQPRRPRVHRRRLHRRQRGQPARHAGGVGDAQRGVGQRRQPRAFRGDDYYST